MSTDARRGRATEIMAVALLAIATVGSAWCAYQASRWNGEEAKLGRAAGEERVEGSRLFALATQTITFDANFIAQYSSAIASGEDKLAEFLLNTLTRPAFRSILANWRAEVDAGQTPTPLLEDPEYLDTQLGPYQESVQRAEQLDTASSEAGETADGYVLATLVLAVALFFAGITNSFRVRLARLFLLAGSGLTIAYAASRIAGLGVA